LKFTNSVIEIIINRTATLQLGAAYLRSINIGRLHCAELGKALCTNQHASFIASTTPILNRERRFNDFAIDSGFPLAHLSRARRSRWQLQELTSTHNHDGPRMSKKLRGEKESIMNTQQQKWSDLLREAVNRPGLILSAYSAFHGYSLGNQLAALLQCQLRGIQPGPINTYIGWQKLNRQVRKGEKAMWLCMPLTRKMKNNNGDNEEVITSFVWKPFWFLLSQTDGESIPTIEIPTWDKDRALTALNISQVEFEHIDGNVQGYARKREVAISPLASLPHKTLFHEIAHIELNHTVEIDFADSEQTAQNLREVEAEACAMLICEVLDLPGTDYARGYIQHWLKGDMIPEKSAMKIFGCADRLLKAGREQL
jgi:hypothetical protein